MILYYINLIFCKCYLYVINVNTYKIKHNTYKIKHYVSNIAYYYY